jgi:putative phosphoesterase
MLIGVLSDTHGRADLTRSAVELLKSRGAQSLIHCGDVGSTQVLDALMGLPASVVFGNVDYDQQTLAHHAKRIGVESYGRLGRKTVGEKTVSFLHGDDSQEMKRILVEQDCDLLFHGHTHVKDVHDVGRIRVVNPGALQRASTRTVALVDSDSRNVEFLQVA